MCGEPGCVVHHAGGRRGKLLTDIRCTVYLCHDGHVPYAHGHPEEWLAEFKEKLPERYADARTAKFHGYQDDYAAYREELGLEY
jgi:hypothetical protein